jgi:FkbM family methyltransferase
MTYAMNLLLLPSKGSDCLTVREMRLGYRMRLDLRSFTEAIASYSRDYDTAEIMSCLKLLTADSVVLDVGANIGFWTVPMAKTLRSGGKVYAFEPLPSNFERLCENLRLNGVEDRVEAQRVGLSDAAGSATLSLREDFSEGSATGNAAIVIDESDLRFRCLPIELNTLDSVFLSRSIERLDFIKIDIEGHEDRFLAGASSTISRFRPALFVEINEPYYARRGLSVEDTFESWLDSNHYICALRTLAGWTVKQIRYRKPIVDNLLFLPIEKCSTLLSVLN